MQSRKSSATFTNRPATGTLKKISFKKETHQPLSNHIHDDPVDGGCPGSNITHKKVLKGRDRGQNTSHLKQQLKVKRKSLNTPFKCSKRRISSNAFVVNLPENSSDKTVHSNGENGINSCDNLSDFWGDDELFADFNISDAVHSSLETHKFKHVSTPKAKTEGACPVNRFPTNEEETFYGLPLEVKNMFSQYRGIEDLYEWQKTCLGLPAVSEKRNLIYSLPTSGGKTLVSEILFLRELILNQKDVIFVLPFVSIVQEKVKNLTQFAVDLGFIIEEYAASKGKFPPRKRRKRKTLYIATIEKANGLINSFIEESRMEALGLVVVDELHMIGEGGRRGAVLEMCLTKLMYTSDHVQIVGMSATLSNIKDLQQFLKADVYTNDFRPVELQEYIKLEDKIYKVVDNDVDQTFVRSLPVQTNKKRSHKDPDNLVVLVTEVIPSHSCLVFCSTKRNCENVALLLVEFMPRELCKIKSKERKDLMKALFNQANGLCPVLKSTIPYGVAYHHSGLTADERILIEDSYSKGTLCVLTCTSTLAAGVNLPAKRVIVRAPYVGSNVIRKSQYKQMIGRAGRAGIDSSGESILILKEKDKYKVSNIFSGPFDSCKSSLGYEDHKGIRLLILSLLGLKVCKTKIDLLSAIKSTLMSIQSNDGQFTEDSTIKAVDLLQVLGHITQKAKENGDIDINITNLGHATYKGCLDVDITPSIYNSVLRQALEGLVLANELHLLYLVTPHDLSVPCDIDWMVYHKQVAVMREDEKKAANAVGISEIFLLGKAYGQRITKCKDEGAVNRFYLTLILYKLIQGKSIWHVADLFKVPRGFVQNLLTSSSSYATCLVHFTQELSDCWSIKLLFEALIKKLTYTASLDLVPLMEIPGVKQGRARQLFTAGYHSLSDVARSDPKTLVQDIEHLFLPQAKKMISAAKMLLQEKADALREEAEELMSSQYLL